MLHLWRSFLGKKMDLNGPKLEVYDLGGTLVLCE